MTSVLRNSPRFHWLHSLKFLSVWKNLYNIHFVCWWLRMMMQLPTGHSPCLYVLQTTDRNMILIRKYFLFLWYILKKLSEFIFLWQFLIALENVPCFIVEFSHIMFWKTVLMRKNKLTQPQHCHIYYWVTLELFQKWKIQTDKTLFKYFLVENRRWIVIGLFVNVFTDFQYFFIISP